MRQLQDLIYKLEEGSGSRLIRNGLLGMLALLLVIGYNARAYKNFTTQEAMDMAQVGRNIAEGRGYSTLLIRPFSPRIRRLTVPGWQCRTPASDRIPADPPAHSANSSRSSCGKSSRRWA